MNYYGSHIPSGRTVVDPRTLSQPIPGTTAVPDFSQFVAEALLKPVLDGFNTAAKNLADTMTPRGPASAKASPVGYHKHHRHDYDCRCHHEDCGCHKDPCHCNCCIVDADLIVYARLGEVRVIPLFLENTWRRERKIITELSPWTSRGGNPAPIKGKLLPPAPEFTLPPCGHQTLTLVVEIEGIPKEGRLPDVDDCTVAYADLRVQGCDIRPIRIAIATLPRDCEAYEIECGCQCCC